MDDQRTERLLFWILIVLHLVPIWWLSYLPTQDGPGHQAVVHIMRELDAPGGAVLRDYYEWSREAVPNWLAFALMLAASAVVSIPMSERLLLSAYVVLLPLSARCALRAVDRQHQYLAIVSFPFIFNFFLQKGFYGFSLSLPACLFTLAYWWPRQDSSRAIHVVSLTILVLLTYMCHLVSAAVVILVIATITLWRSLDTWLNRTPLLTPRSIARDAAGRLARIFAAFLPTLLLMGTFVAARMERETWTMPLGQKLLRFGSLYSLAATHELTVVVSTLLAAAFFGTAIAVAIGRIRLGGNSRSDGLLAAVLVTVIVYFAAPTVVSSGAYLAERLLLYPYLLALLWFAASGLGARSRFALETTGAALAVTFLLLCWPRWVALDDYIAEYVSAIDHIESDHTVLALVYSRSGVAPDGRPMSFGIRPFLHASGHLAVRKMLVDLRLYQGNTDHFPIRYKPERNPFVYVGATSDLELEVPRANFLDYPARTGGRVDYVVLWQPEAAPADHPNVVYVQSQLSKGYDRIYVSPRRLVHVYRNRLFQAHSRDDNHQASQ